MHSEKPKCLNGCMREIVDRLRSFLSPGAAIVCTGNELCGDDAAGLFVAGLIANAGPWRVYNVGSAPENFLFTIAQANPPAVLLVDATDFGGPPGAVTLIDADSVAGQGPCTHGPAPEAFLELLAQVHPCKSAVLGIQPASSAVGAPLSDAVAAAVRSVAETLRSLSALPAD